MGTIADELATYPPETRAALLPVAIAQREADVARLRLLLVERYGTAPHISKLLERDVTLAALKALA